MFASTFIWCRAHLVLGWLGILCEERRGADQNAASAEAALGRLLGEEGFLERV